MGEQCFVAWCTERRIVSWAWRRFGGVDKMVFEGESAVGQGYSEEVTVFPRIISPVLDATAVTSTGIYIHTRHSVLCGFHF